MCQVKMNHEKNLRELFQLFQKLFLIYRLTHGDKNTMIWAKIQI